MDPLALGCILLITGQIPDFHRLELYSTGRTDNEESVALFAPLPANYPQFRENTQKSLAGNPCKASNINGREGGIRTHGGY